jgi:DNA adenine methylase
MSVLAPFPHFGGKSRIASAVWDRLGADCANFVDPFAGSAAFLLDAPDSIKIRTINDADGFITNFWRAVAQAPDDVAHWLDWPVNEADLFARHAWLVKQRDALTERLHADPDYFDAKIAGWWCWGACAWIGSGWCEGRGPWQVVAGEVVHLGNAGRGINRQLPHLGDAGQGINRKLPHLGDAGKGEREMITDHLITYMHTLADRLRRARVTCGDWTRVVQPSVTIRHGLTAVVLDPPYGEGEVDYAAGGNRDGDIAADVWTWAIENGTNPLLRIAVCGYDDGRAVPAGWTVMRWKARKGYQVSNANPRRETVWFSPHCISDRQPMLFAESEAV